MDRHTAAVCSSVSHKPHCRLAELRIRAANIYVDYVDSSDIWSAYRPECASVIITKVHNYTQSNTIAL